MTAEELLGKLLRIPRNQLHIEVVYGNNPDSFAPVDGVVIQDGKFRLIQEK